MSNDNSLVTISGHEMLLMHTGLLIDTLEMRGTF